ncbi:lantibiotic dehydratase C-terminal domain-containing protein [Deinococcus cellulosilyticus]|uniref:Thiopeptide-type bacteriocin biosynthesis domain-containing protein n=1 Tax=Deinococcus cellulosilyticus (strain DSM 18568 / NBRC 106333 / KACC 11606 / 5516J-15) TaxID=1223518 RepID=A0A511N207_DEIC1|nr:lantibiotic dehydratase C-terminal domain-containing protein [Deinococcus cellulosilyticus]GEM46895.1 hypothetical protein DC3_25300 [Deinococcus cellulosilyticus NBRC 106333 = KACC 11606]
MLETLFPHDHRDHWRTLRVVHHAPDKDLLMLGLYSALHQLKAEGLLDGFYLQRHWLNGPQVQVHVRPFPGQEEQVRERLITHASTLVEQGSPLELDETTYLKKYAQTAAAELVTDPLLPLYPSGTVLWGPLLMRERMFGGEFNARVARSFFASTQSVLEVALQPEVASRGKLMQFARWMFGFAGAFRGLGEDQYCSTTSVALSFRSHAEAYYHNGGNALRSQFEAKYTACQDVLQKAYQEATTDPAPDLRWLIQNLRSAYQWLFQARLTGEMVMPTLQDYEGLKPQVAEGAEFREYSFSPGHQELADPDSELSRLLREPEVEVRRLLINLLYNHLVTAGARPLDRFFLCEMVARTIEEAHRGQDIVYPRPRPVAAEMR